MTLSGAFTFAWQELKSMATKAEAFIAKEQPVIDSSLKSAAVVAGMVNPVVGVALSTFDSLEEAIVGKVLALAHNTSTAPDVQTLFAEDWPVIQALVAQLKTATSVLAASGTQTVPAVSPAPTVTVKVS